MNDIEEQATIAKLKARYHKGLYLTKVRASLGLTGSYEDRMISRDLYRMGAIPAVFPVPAIPTGGFISQLWINAKHGRQERKVRKWYLTLCFDKKGYYID